MMHMNMDTIRFAWDTLSEEEINVFSTPEFVYEGETGIFGINTDQQEMRIFPFRATSEITFEFTFSVAITKNAITLNVVVISYFNDKRDQELEPELLKTYIKQIEPIFKVLDKKAHRIKEMLESDPKTRLFFVMGGKTIRVVDRTKTELKKAKREYRKWKKETETRNGTK